MALLNTDALELPGDDAHDRGVVLLALAMALGIRGTGGED